MAKLGRRSISRRTVEALKVDRDTVVLGLRAARLRRPGVPIGRETLHRADPRPGLGEAADHRPARRHHAGGGAAARGADHRAHQGGRGPGAGAAGGEAPGGADRRRARRAVSRGICRGALQAEHRTGVPPHGEQAHRAGAREAAGRGRAARARARPALRDAGDAGAGQPDAGPAVAHVQHGRVLGADPRGKQPLPGHGEIPPAAARAVPHGGRVPPARARARRGGGRRRRLGACRGGRSAC